MRLKHRLAWVVLLVAIAVGCGSLASGPTASPGVTSPAASSLQPAPSQDPSLAAADQAVEVARQRLTSPDATLTAVDSGSFGEMFRRYTHRPTYLEQPEPEDAERRVWAVQFATDVEICGPDGGECLSRPALVTVFLDQSTYDWIRTSTYSPSEGGPLPTPLPS